MQLSLLGVTWISVNLSLAFPPLCAHMDCILSFIICAPTHCSKYNSGNTQILWEMFFSYYSCLVHKDSVWENSVLFRFPSWYLGWVQIPLWKGRQDVGEAFTELVLLSSWTCNSRAIPLLTEESCSGVVLESVTIKGRCQGGDTIRFMHVWLRQNLACFLCFGQSLSLKLQLCWWEFFLCSERGSFEFLGDFWSPHEDSFQTFSFLKASDSKSLFFLKTLFLAWIWHSYHTKVLPWWFCWLLAS